MNTDKLKEGFSTFSNHPVTKNVVEITKTAVTMVAVGFAVKAITFIAVAGTSALIAEINKQVNGDKTN